MAAANDAFSHGDSPVQVDHHRAGQVVGDHDVLPGRPQRTRHRGGHAGQLRRRRQQVDHRQRRVAAGEGEQALAAVLLEVEGPHDLGVGEDLVHVRPVPGVVPAGDRVHAGVEELVDDLDGHAEPVHRVRPGDRAVLGVHHDPVQPVVRAQLRYPPGQPAGRLLPHDVTDAEDTLRACGPAVPVGGAHAPTPAARARPRDRRASVARRAPSVREASLAQAILGWTGRNEAKVEKPQSVPAMTRSTPTVSA